MLSGRTFRFLLEKIAFERIHKKNRGSRKPRTPRITSRGKQGKARACDRAARPCIPRKITTAGQRSGTATPCQAARSCCWARSGSARWHGCATAHGLVVLLGTVVPWSRRGAYLKVLRFFCQRSFSSFVLFVSRERLEGFFRVLDSCFWNEVVKINWRLLTLISSFNSSLFLSPLLFDSCF